jgi:hypothetical protein
MISDAGIEQTGHESKAKVFISYSRKDMAFADRLEAALKARGFEPLIDRTDIYAFEEWWKRIEALIARADTVVFVLSPDAVASDVALREVAHAASLNKRFAPVVCRRIDHEAVPEALAIFAVFQAVESPRRAVARRIALSVMSRASCPSQYAACCAAVRSFTPRQLKVALSHLNNGEISVFFWGVTDREIPFLDDRQPRPFRPLRRPDGIPLAVPCRQTSSSTPAARTISAVASSDRPVN